MPINNPSQFPRGQERISFPERRRITPPPLPSRPIDDKGGYTGRFISGSRTEATRGGGAAATIPPFHLEDASNPDDGTQVRVYYGTVNDEVPAGMSNGDSPPYYLSVSGDGLVWLIVTLDTDFSVNSVAIDLGGTIPDDDLASKTFYKQIGSWSVDGSAVNVADNLTGSQEFQLCGGEALWGVV